MGDLKVCTPCSRDTSWPWDVITILSKKLVMGGYYNINKHKHKLSMGRYYNIINHNVAMGEYYNIIIHKLAMEDITILSNATCKTKPTMTRQTDNFCTPYESRNVHVNAKCSKKRWWIWKLCISFQFQIWFIVLNTVAPVFKTQTPFAFNALPKIEIYSSKLIGFAHLDCLPPNYNGDTICGWM